MRNLLLILSLISTLPAWANEGKLRDIKDELIYSQDYNPKDFGKAIPYAQKSAGNVDALWDMALIERSQNGIEKVVQELESMSLSSLSAADLVRLMALANRLHINPGRVDIFKKAVVKKLNTTLNYKSLMVIFNLEKDFNDLSLQETFKKVADANKEAKKLHAATISDPLTAVTAQQLHDLYHSSVPTSMGDRTQIFVFCRTNRAYPCRILLKDHQDYPVYDEKGELWSKPILGHSRLVLPFNQSNGDTPSGVYLINGVMPAADQQIYYGKNRRLIIDFLTSSASLAALKNSLPSSHSQLSWWKQAYIAQVIGRTALRLHGEGEIVNNPSTPYYPLLPSLGCLKMREGKYGDINYNDQRLLLDKLMVAHGLRAVYENETKINSLLYVINLDKQEKAVSLNEIKALIQ